jgi:TetR/AcrR family transcriptional regulator, cholesterol catabolism regulator
MPKGIPLTAAEQVQRRREIFAAAVNLFLSQGFQETSMRAIADAARVGKSTLYDYFQTKDEILLFVLEEAMLQLTGQAQAIVCQDIPADQRLRRIMELDLDFLQANKNFYLRLNAEVSRLKLESQKRIQEQRYAFQDLVRGVIEEGIRAGNFRKVDPLLAARLLINSLGSVVFTSRPTGDLQDMFAQAVGIFFNGITVEGLVCLRGMG